MHMAQYSVQSLCKLSDFKIEYPSVVISPIEVRYM